MNPAERFERAMEIFLKAVDLPTGQRDSLIARECGTDTALRDEVQSLLAHDGDDAMVATDLSGAAQVLWDDLASASATLTLPEQIGSYRIVREIGRGGAGVVYEARQDSPSRTVALKVLSSGTTQNELVRRFQREAELLGRLRHPGIAQIFEAGVADMGGARASVRQAYIAMELIDGQPIDLFVRHNNLDLRGRLALFAKVCDAVHHAHERGVVHRDLKPANILVERDGQPKVLDFGVSRTTDADIHTVTLQTNVGQLMGTVPYMSPEQVQGDPSAIDARSDVYSMGVVLFELLGSRLPYDVRSQPVPGAVRMIQEQDPTRLGSINRLFRGDVETIVATALEKEPARRYPSAAAMAADLRRFLASEPITVRPPSAFYRIRKFTRRHRVLVGGFAGTLMALLIGLIGTGYFLIEAVHQRDDAMLARHEADRERERTAEIADFQADLLASLRAQTFGKKLKRSLLKELRADADDERAKADYSAVKGALRRANMTNVARSVLSGSLADRAVKRIESEFADDPVTAAQLRLAIAKVYRGLGMLPAALEQRQKALEIRTEHLGPSHIETLQSMNAVALVYREMGRLAEAEALYREALDRGRQMLGEDHLETLSIMANLAGLFRSQGALGEAAHWSRQALAGFESTLGAEHRRTLKRKNTFCAILLEQGRLDEALSCFQELLETQERVGGADHRHTVLVRNNLMASLFKVARFDEAEPIAHDVLLSNQRIHGDDHPNTIMARNNLGVVLLNVDKNAEAEEEFRIACGQARAALNPVHEVRQKSISNRIDALLALERYDEARPLCDELLAVRRGLRPPRPTRVAQTLEQLGHVFFHQQRYGEARDTWRECVELRESVATDHWATHRARSELGAAMVALGEFEDAASLLLESYASLESQQESLPPVIRDKCLRDARARIVALYEAWGRPTDAARWAPVAPTTARP